MKLHHLGIACSDILETANKIKQIFPVTSVTDVIFDPMQNVEACMIFITGSVPFELIAGDVVKNHVKKNILIYHSCWEVLEIEKEIERLCSEGCHLISEPKQAVFFNLRRIAFLSSPVGIVELLEGNYGVFGHNCEVNSSITGEIQL